VQEPEIFKASRDWPRLASAHHKPNEGSRKKILRANI